MLLVVLEAKWDAGRLEALLVSERFVDQRVVPAYDVVCGRAAADVVRPQRRHIGVVALGHVWHVVVEEPRHVAAKEQVAHSGYYAYRDRRVRMALFR